MSADAGSTIRLGISAQSPLASSVDGSNNDFGYASSAETAVVTVSVPGPPTTTTAGGGAGGGGGGGGGPSFHVSIGGPPGQASIGSTVTLIVAISNSAGNADSATLHATAVGLQFVSAKVDRGSGCTAEGSGASCFLDFFNSGLASSEELTFRLTSLPASASASVTSPPTGTSDTGTWSASTPTASQPATSSPTAPTATPRTTVTASSALTSAKPPAAVKPAGKNPMLTLTVVLSQKRRS